MDDAAKKKTRKDVSSPGNVWEAGRKSMERIFEATGDALRAARKDYGTSSEKSIRRGHKMRSSSSPPPYNHPLRGVC